MGWYGLLTSQPTRGMGRYIEFFISHITGWDGIFVGYPMCQALAGISVRILGSQPCFSYDYSACRLYR